MTLPLACLCFSCTCRTGALRFTLSSAMALKRCWSRLPALPMLLPQPPLRTLADSAEPRPEVARLIVAQAGVAVEVAVTSSPQMVAT